MGLLDKIHRAISGMEEDSPEHLEGYRRIGDEVYQAQVELSDAQNPRVLLLLRVAEYFQTVANALLLIPTLDSKSLTSVPQITHLVAEDWFGRIPELLIAARQEAIVPNSSTVVLPIQLGQPRHSDGTCPLSHLAGLRRATDAAFEFVTPDVSRVRVHPEQNAKILLLYEETRTRKNTADAIVGSLSEGKKIPSRSHEEAREEYWKGIRQCLLITQGLRDISLLPSRLGRRSTLDLEDPWKVTSRLAISDIRTSGEDGQVEQELRTLWDRYPIRDAEHTYINTVEDLQKRGKIVENGYWFRVPFQSVYQVKGEQVEINGSIIPRGHEFVFDFGDEHEPGRLRHQASFGYSEDREHGDTTDS